MSSENTREENQLKGRNALNKWRTAITDNIYSADALLDHSVRFAVSDNCDEFILQLKSLGNNIVKNLEPLVAENDFRLNMPRLDSYDGIGNLANEIVHHPNYQKVGNAIYATGMMGKLVKPGKLTESLLLFYLTSHLGEAGHNCPVACTAGIIRVLGKVADFSGKTSLLEKLTTASFSNNFTGAQFITEVQGGSDVALNSCKAVKQTNGMWHISGEKWFCSNANADLILLTARFDENKTGTKGLGL
ncbi:MAG: acyl-CoA dehydrogenase family protein, partial [Proteobacteria bacterium]|nr:acyl-CoA dehydrogenase family protein [Pseudomonadota bacterium]